MTVSPYEIAKQLHDKGITPAKVTLTDVYNADGFSEDFSEVQMVLASLVFLDHLDSVAETLAAELREQGTEQDEVDGNLLVDIGIVDQLADLVKDKI